MKYQYTQKNITGKLSKLFLVCSHGARNLIQILTQSIIFTIFLFASFHTVYAGVILKPPVNLNMVGYWPFISNTGSYAYDMSGNSLTGNLAGNTAWTSGHTDNALVFDGDGDYVQINDIGGALNPGNDSWTMSVWIQTTSSSGTIAERYTCGWNCYAVGSSADYALSLNSGKIVYNLRTTDGSDTVISLESTSTVNDGKWHYIAGVLNRSSGVASVYIDGILENSIDASTFGLIANDGTPLFLGVHYIQNWASPQQYFTGSIDEFRIYRNALSPDQIQRIYSQVVHKAPNNNGLVGYWSFEDATGTKATDFSGNQNTGTLTNMNTNTAWVDGKQGKALQFDGVDDYVDMGNSQSLSFSGSHTVSVWVYPTAEGAEFVSNVTGTVIYEKEGGLVGQALTWGNGRFNFMVNNGGIHSVWGSSGKALNQWYFVTGVYDGKIHLYVNGVEEVVSGDGAFIPNTATPVLIGKHSSGDRYFPGSIDEVRVYSRALSATEVSTLYNSTKSGHVTIGITPRNILDNGLIGHWTFDGKDLTTTTAIDTSGNNNNGTLTNGPTPVRGKVGQALSFDGVDQYVLTSSVATSKTSDVSFSTWVYWKGDTSKMRFIFGNGNTATNGYGLIINDGMGHIGNKVTLLIGGKTWNGLTSLVTMPSNRWVFLTLTRSSAGTWSLYLDGTLEAQGTTDPVIPTTSFQISGSAANQFDGYIDDFRVYSRDLSASEVTILYNLGH